MAASTPDRGTPVPMAVSTPDRRAPPAPPAASVSFNDDEDARLLEEGGTPSSGTPRTRFFNRLRRNYGAIPAWRESFANSNHSASEVIRSLTSSGLARSPGKGLRESFRGSFKSVVSAAQRRCSIIDHKGTATIKSEVINLMNNIVGSGIIALPSGVAAFGNSPSALIPATVLIWLVGFINAYYFSLIGRLCAMTGATSYREAWEMTVGDRGSGVVAAVVTLKAVLALLMLSVILADSFHSLFQTVGLAMWTRAQVITVITLLTLLPLCLIKNMDALAPFSFVGLCCILFTGLMMTVRCLDGTYDMTDDRVGRFIDDIDEDNRPLFGDVGAGGAFSVRSMVLVCMLSTAYVAHYNAPRFYVELKDNTIRRFNIVIGIAFGLCALIFVAISAVGFLTFGANSSGYVLNNYSNSDSLATACRVAFSVAAIGTYPVLFVGARDGIVDVIKLPVDEQVAGTLNLISIATLTSVTLLAIFCSDLGFIVSIGGATLATAIIFVFPAFMFRAVVRGRGDGATDGQRRELRISLFMMGVGIVIGVIGVWMSFDGAG